MPVIIGDKISGLPGSNYALLDYDRLDGMPVVLPYANGDLRDATSDDYQTRFAFDGTHLLGCGRVAISSTNRSVTWGNYTATNFLGVFNGDAEANQHRSGVNEYYYNWRDRVWREFVDDTPDHWQTYPGPEDYIGHFDDEDAADLDVTSTGDIAIYRNNSGTWVARIVTAFTAGTLTYRYDWENLGIDESLLDLLDTPDSYAGSNNYFLKISSNSTTSFIEFIPLDVTAGSVRQVGNIPTTEDDSVIYLTHDVVDGTKDDITITVGSFGNLVGFRAGSFGSAPNRGPLEEIFGTGTTSSYTIVELGSRNRHWIESIDTVDIAGTEYSLQTGTSTVRGVVSRALDNPPTLTSSTFDFNVEIGGDWYYSDGTVTEEAGLYLWEETVGRYVPYITGVELPNQIPTVSNIPTANGDPVIFLTHPFHTGAKDDITITPENHSNSSVNEYGYSRGNDLLEPEAFGTASRDPGPLEAITGTYDPGTSPVEYGIGFVASHNRHWLDSLANVEITISGTATEYELEDSLFYAAEGVYIRAIDSGGTGEVDETATSYGLNFKLTDDTWYYTDGTTGITDAGLYEWDSSSNTYVRLGEEIVEVSSGDEPPPAGVATLGKVYIDYGIPKAWVTRYGLGESTPAAATWVDASASGNYRGSFGADPNTGGDGDYYWNYTTLTWCERISGVWTPQADPTDMANWLSTYTWLGIFYTDEAAAQAIPNPYPAGQIMWMFSLHRFEETATPAPRIIQQSGYTAPIDADFEYSHFELEIKDAQDTRGVLFADDESNTLRDPVDDDIGKTVAVSRRGVYLPVRTWSGNTENTGTWVRVPVGWSVHPHYRGDYYDITDLRHHGVSLGNGDFFYARRDRRFWYSTDDFGRRVGPGDDPHGWLGHFGSRSEAIIHGSGRFQWAWTGHHVEYLSSFAEANPVANVEWHIAATAADQPTHISFIGNEVMRSANLTPVSSSPTYDTEVEVDGAWTLHQYGRDLGFSQENTHHHLHWHAANAQPIFGILIKGYHDDEFQGSTTMIFGNEEDAETGHVSSTVRVGTGRYVRFQVSTRTSNDIYIGTFRGAGDPVSANVHVRVYPILQSER